MQSVGCVGVGAAARATALVLFFAVGCLPPLGAEEPAPSDSKAEAAALVQKALAAEAAGAAEARRTHLKAALEKDPALSLAHWASGEVYRERRWMSLDQAAQAAASDPALAEYQRQRALARATVESQRALAVWCREHGLSGESRTHWYQVLLIEPGHREAQAACGMVLQGGELVSAAEARRARAAEGAPSGRDAQRAERDAVEDWAARVSKWRRNVRRDEAEVRQAIEAEVAAAQDPQSIHALGVALLQGSRQKSDPEAFRLMSRALVDALDRCSQRWSTLQLAWYAVEHPTAEVRNAAADALKNRSPLTYVPWLLGHMQAPVEARISVTASDVAGVSISQTFEREWPDAVYRDVRQQYYCAGTPCVTLIRRENKVSTNIPQVQRASWAAAESKVAATREQVDRFNANVRDLNQRIAAAVARATGEALDGDPLVCHRWWTKYCADYYELEPAGSDRYASGPGRNPYPHGYGPPQPGGDKPVIENRTSYGNPLAASVVYTVCSCFPAETPVWTLTGPVEIRKIQPGDRVLTQHPVCGQLSYRTVFQVTRRKPSPMIEVGLGGETLRSTRGHPFWVSGRGWLMAKQLTPGMWLHSTDGPVHVESVREAPAALPWHEQPGGLPGDELSYNLVLDEVHNYFVGAKRVLAHDNTLYPLDGPLPGVPGLAGR